MVTVLQVGLRDGSALVAVGHQLTVLPENALRLNAPRMVERIEERCEKAFWLVA
jgi:hypothetical protein